MLARQLYYPGMSADQVARVQQSLLQAVDVNELADRAAALQLQAAEYGAADEAAAEARRAPDQAAAAQAQGQAEQAQAAQAAAARAQAAQAAVARAQAAQALAAMPGSVHAQPAKQAGAQLAAAVHPLGPAGAPGGQALGYAGVESDVAGPSYYQVCCAGFGCAWHLCITCAQPHLSTCLDLSHAFNQPTAVIYSCSTKKVLGACIWHVHMGHPKNT